VSDRGHEHDRDGGERDDGGLAGALVALREEPAGADAAAAAATRRRILLAAAATRRRKLLLLRVVAPLAAVLAIGTAWAAAGRRLPWQEPSPSAPRSSASLVAPSSAGTAAVAAASVATAPATATVPAVPAAPSEPAAAPPPGVSAATTLDTAAATAPSSVPPARAAATAAADREDTLYRAAHEAHFVARDAARALAAWDAYLAAFPRGRLAPEARYNRALVLVRLGRKDEARAALAPFADAPPGSYRQAEARSLLDALE
jgi:hypothetical protein